MIPKHEPKKEQKRRPMTRKHAYTEHPFKFPQPVEYMAINTTESIAGMSRKSLRNDIDIAIGIESLVLLGIKEVEEEFLQTGKINMQKLKILQPFYQSAKAFLPEALEKLESLEKTMDSELLYGSNVVLKDPQARERVRKTILSFMNLANKESGEDKASQEDA